MPGMADWLYDLWQRRQQKPFSTAPLPQLESEARHDVGLFDRPEAPPTPLNKAMSETIGGQFMTEAANQVGPYLSAPGGLGISGTTFRLPQSRPLTGEILPPQSRPRFGTQGALGALDQSLSGQYYDRFRNVFDRRYPVSDLHLVRDYPWARVGRMREGQANITRGQPDTPISWRESDLSRANEGGQPLGDRGIVTERQVSPPVTRMEDLPPLPRNGTTPPGVPSITGPRPTTEDYNWARTQLPKDASLAERTAVATQRAIWRTQQPLPYTRGHQPTGLSEREPGISTEEALRRLNEALQPQPPTSSNMPPGGRDVTPPPPMNPTNQSTFRNMSLDELRRYEREQSGNLSLAERGDLYREIAARNPQPSTYNWEHGLTQQQRQVIQNRIDAGYQPPANPAELGRQLGPHAAPLGAPQFDINRFRQQQPGTTPPDAPLPTRAEIAQMIASSTPTIAAQGIRLARELEAREAAAGMAARAPRVDRPEPAPGEFGNFMEPRVAPAPTKSLEDRLMQVPNARRREASYEMPLSKVIKENRSGGNEEYWKVNYEPRPNDPRGYGQVSAYIDKRAKTLKISSSNMPESVQSRGYGQEAYRRLFDEAIANGYTIVSDTMQSPYSYRLYPKFGEQGFNVERNPNIRNVGGRYPYQSSAGNYRISGKLPAPDLPPLSLADRMTLRGIEPSQFDAPLGVPRLPRRRRREE